MPSKSDRLLLGMLTVCLLAFPIPSCSFVQPMEQEIKITTDKPATLYFGKEVVGETTEANNLTVTLKMKRNETRSVRAESTDGGWANGKVDTQLSGLGILDIVGGVLLLVPFITLFTGHAFELSPTTLKLQLRDVGKAPADGGQGSGILKD